MLSIQSSNEKQNHAGTNLVVTLSKIWTLGDGRLAGSMRQTVFPMQNESVFNQFGKHRAEVAGPTLLRPQAGCRPVVFNHKMSNSQN